jgi:hypothetical protein
MHILASCNKQFTAAFNDLKFTLYRYGYCVNGLQPVTSARFNETEFLVNQIRSFLDQGNYDNEQLANVSSLMDTICRTSAEPSYPISVHVDIQSFNSSTNPNAKATRCRAIDTALDSMYHVFKKAALNHSEPLDFSSVLFYPNETDRSAFYNLSDLINTSWITSEVVLEHVCSITNATKEYVQMRSSNSTAQSRRQDSARVSTALFELVDSLLEPFLGLQKRLYWESTNRLEFLQTLLSSGLSSIRSGIGSGLSRTRSFMWWSRTNSTSSTLTNSTESRWTNMTTNTTRLTKSNSTVRPFNSTGTTSTPMGATSTTRLPSTV